MKNATTSDASSLNLGAIVFDVASFFSSNGNTPVSAADLTLSLGFSGKDAVWFATWALEGMDGNLVVNEAMVSMAN